MARTTIEFDPGGYFYTSEPGLQMTLNGRDFMEKLRPKDGKPETVRTGLYNPPGSEWLLCEPRQWDPRWYTDIRMVYHVMNRDLWTYAAGCTVREWVESRLPGTSDFEYNKWQNVVVSSEAVSLDAMNYTGLATAAGITLPTGMITVGFCSRMALGGIPEGIGDPTLTGEETPYFQWMNFPAPWETLVFGWSNLCLILSGDNVYVLQNRENDKQTWRLLAPPGKARAYQIKGTTGGDAQSGLTSGRPTSISARSILGMIVGYEHLYLFNDKREPLVLKVRDRERVPGGFSGLALPAGPFWIGAARGQVLQHQTQVVGYSTADSRLMNVPEPITPMFDLGSSYRPTMSPSIQADTAMHSLPDAPAEFTTEPDGAILVTEPTYNQLLRYGVLNGAGDPWVSDGTLQRGSFYVQMIPGVESLWGQYSPMLHVLDVDFPIVLSPRVNSPLTLTDGEWQTWSAESSHDDPYGKTLEITIPDPSVRRLIAAGLDQRGEFPIHVLEGGDVRAAGWVKSLDLKLHRIDDPDTGEAVQFYTLHCEGLTSLLNDDWGSLPQIVDTTGGGFIEHTFAVKSVLKSRGFDTNNLMVYLPRTDPHAGTAVSQLPGTWGLVSAPIGQRVDSPYAPDWDKTPREYLRALENFRGWRLYEELGGLVRYHDDLGLMAALGYPHYAPTVLYWTKAAATAAGTPRQYILADPEKKTQEPEGNVIRITAAAAEDSLIPTYMAQDRASIEGPTTYPHFMGRLKYKGFVTKLGIDDASLSQICHVRLLLARRRRVFWTVTVPLAPWRFSPQPVEAGRCVRVAGDHFGSYLVVHVETRQIKSADTTDKEFFETRLTLEKLPSESTRSETEGDYPGSGAPPEEEED